MNRKSEVLLNANSKLSLKKVAVANARLRLFVDGSKKTGLATYKVQMPQSAETSLLTIE